MLQTRLHICTERTWQQLYWGAKRGKEKNAVLLPKQVLVDSTEQKRCLAGREEI